MTVLGAMDVRGWRIKSSVVRRMPAGTFSAMAFGSVAFVRNAAG